MSLRKEAVEGSTTDRYRHLPRDGDGSVGWGWGHGVEEHKHGDEVFK